MKPLLGNYEELVQDERPPIFSLAEIAKCIQFIPLPWGMRNQNKMIFLALFHHK